MIDSIRDMPYEALKKLKEGKETQLHENMTKIKELERENICLQEEIDSLGRACNVLHSNRGRPL